MLYGFPTGLSVTCGESTSEICMQLSVPCVANTTRSRVIISVKLLCLNMTQVLYLTSMKLYGTVQIDASLCLG